MRELLYLLPLAPKQTSAKFRGRRVRWGQLLQAGLSWRSFDFRIRVPSEEARAAPSVCTQGHRLTGQLVMLVAGRKSLDGDAQGFSLRLRTGTLFFPPNSMGQSKSQGLRVSPMPPNSC